MNDDLHCRLRDRSQRFWVTEQDLLDNLLFREASDSIEELVKELNISRVANVVMDNTVEELEAKLTECEARLSKAVEALDEAVKWVDRYRWAAPWVDDAHATLAEIKGGNDAESNL